MAHLIEDCLSANSLKLSSIIACVRDDAKNMQKTCRLLQIESFQCSAHLYHLAVSAALAFNACIKELLDIVRQWTGSTHRSNLAKLFKSFQIAEKLPNKRIPMVIFKIYVAIV